MKEGVVQSTLYVCYQEVHWVWIIQISKNKCLWFMVSVIVESPEMVCMCASEVHFIRSLTLRTEIWCEFGAIIYQFYWQENHGWKKCKSIYSFLKILKWNMTSFLVEFIELFVENVRNVSNSQYESKDVYIRPWWVPKTERKKTKWTKTSVVRYHVRESRTIFTL